MRLGILTGGGDCPGLNAAIRGVVLNGERRYGDSFLGFKDGWRGVLENDAMPLAAQDVEKLIGQGGTILGSSRTNPFAHDGGVMAVKHAIVTNHLDGLVTIGGDDTLGAAHRLAQEGIVALGVPKTIDNDLSGTEVTFGFHTAVQIASDAIDRLNTTAESHHRILVVEVMGRSVGWIATYAGIAGGVAEILVPETPFTLDEICARLQARYERGDRSSIVVVAEGALPKEGPARDAAMAIAASDHVDQFGHAQLGGIGAWVAGAISKATGHESRATALGHIQRGGTPTAFDRILATRFGVGASEAIHRGESDVMVALQADKIVTIPLSEAVGNSKRVDPTFFPSLVNPLLG
jgi:6-phosphofructokinase 1